MVCPLIKSLGRGWFGIKLGEAARSRLRMIDMRANLANNAHQAMTSAKYEENSTPSLI